VLLFVIIAQADTWPADMAVILTVADVFPAKHLKDACQVAHAKQLPIWPQHLWCLLKTAP
jgi:hypothetical protein